MSPITRPVFVFASSCPERFPPGQPCGKCVYENEAERPTVGGCSTVSLLYTWNLAHERENLCECNAKRREKNYAI